MVIEVILGVGRMRQVYERRLRRERPIDTRYVYVGRGKISTTQTAVRHLPFCDIRQAIDAKVVFAITQPNTPDPNHERNGKADGTHLLVGVMRKGMPRLPTDQTAKFMRLRNCVLPAEDLQGKDVRVGGCG